MKGEQPLRLDRMAVEEVGANPELLAAAIHEQLGPVDGSVPVEAIARALDIVEIRTQETSGLAGALVTTDERDIGMILVKAGTTRQRRRFTVAHEVGHFLSPWHEATVPDGFACTPQDLAVAWQVSTTGSRHQVQESEANRFAIELLAPRRLIRPKLLRGTPDLEQVIELAGDLDISREASARRWRELRDDGIALVFGKDGLVRYVERSPEFPFVVRKKQERLTTLPNATDATGLSNHDEADWRDWLRNPPPGDLVIQALHQKEGFTIALLTIDGVDDD